MGKKLHAIFFNLEKRHYITKTMSRLCDKDGSFITDEGSIVDTVKTFFESLYKKGKVEHCNISELVDNIPQLLLIEMEQLEEEISYDEACFALKQMKNMKSPETDGFSADFFKMFLGRLGHLLLDP